MRSEYTDLFSTHPNLLVVKTFRPKWPYTTLHKWVPVWKTFDHYNYMEMDGYGAEKGKTIINAPNRNIYYKGTVPLNAERVLTSLLEKR